MRIVLIGTGRMGSAVAEAAAGRGWTVVQRFDLERPLTAADPMLAEQADAAIDFSSADAALGHISACASAGLPLVIGTTGWHGRLEEARDRVAGTNGAVLFAPNFSLGVAVLARALRSAAALLDRIPEFDVSIHEVHHTAKVDSPSGTALRLGELLLDEIGRKTHLAPHPASGPVDPSGLQITSARVGSEFGLHTVWIDGPSDRLTFTHEARSRRGFAEGALSAAAWLRGRAGFFSLDDMLDDWLASPASVASPESSTSTP